MRDDDGVVAGATSKLSAVTLSGLNVADDGTLGKATDGEYVADSEVGLATAVNELTGVHAFHGNHEFVVSLEAVGILERHAGKGSTTAGVMDDLLDHAFHVTLALSIVAGAELGGSLALRGVTLWGIDERCKGKSALK